MPKACLIIVFNHRYDKNIPVLEQVYGPRFSNIRFLVPFYDGTNPNVIPVYESSHYFQSYFAQAATRIAREDFTHYIFTGDDCLLNPTVNETNFLDQTGLPENTDFIPELLEFQTEKGVAWWHGHKGIDFFHNRKGAEIQRELPSREEAIARFQHHGLTVRPLSMQNIFGTVTPPGKKGWQYWLYKQYHFRFKWKKYVQQGKVELPYPITGSYSDILIVTAQNFHTFCRYCGIMAAAGLFVEIAIPTAMVLSSKRIMQEKDMKLKGKALWTAEDIGAVETQFNRSLTALLAGFPKDQLFYHPVKLSKWTNDL